MIRRSVAVAAIALALLAGTTITVAACNLTGQASETEVEDCDAEDYANRERECGFTDSDRKKKPNSGTTTRKKR